MTETPQPPAKKAAAKKAPSKAAASGVKVRFLESSRGIKAGSTKTVDKTVAAELIRNRHAVKA